jgi:hypothetical protein
MTVLYARSGTGLISRRLACATWYAFRRVGRWLPRTRDTLLSFSGPVIVVLMVGVWVWLLVIGFALIFWPALGHGVGASHDPIPTDFSSAIYISGSSITTVGSGDFYPRTSLYRVLAVLASILGISTLTLCLTYLLEIYNALLRRNTFALRLHHATGDTGDAAELLAGLLNGEDPNAARSGLANFSIELLHLYESQHFYPELMFFRFRNPAYALARAVQVTMDLVSLLRSTLDERQAKSLFNSAVVKQFWGGGRHLLVEVARVFLPEHRRPAAPDELPHPTPEVEARWRRRYFAALETLRAAGVKTTQDPESGFRLYLDLRRQWDSYMLEFARYMEYAPEEVDPPGYGQQPSTVQPAKDDAEQSDDAPPFKAAG